MNFTPSRITVIAPHPDDETIALGGTISRFSSNNCHVSILIVSGHLPPIYSEAEFLKTQQESENAFKILKVKNHKFEKIPATYIHEKPVSQINSLISNFIRETKPDIVFIPYPDRHIDHRTIFDASVVACRPVDNNFPKWVLAYETLSETHWNVPGIEPAFVPELFIDISDYIDTKNKALMCYKSQIEGNKSRSVEACNALAKFRGSQNNCDFAEAFKVVRIVI